MAAIALVLVASTSCKHPARPNVVIISLDTVRSDAIAEVPEGAAMPHWERFRAQASSYSSAYATTPFTLSSHLTMITGASARVHRVRHRRKRLSERIESLPEYLQRAGYWTGGVYSSELLGPEFGFGRGFEEWIVEGGGAGAIRLRAEELLAQAHRSGKPIFLFVHFYDAHSDPHLPNSTLPYRTPDELESPMPGADRADPFCDDEGRCASELLLACNRDGRRLSEEQELELSRLYRSGVQYLLSEIDLLLGHFDHIGLWSDSLIILTADHGEELGEHGMYLHDQLYDEVIRIPLFIHYPRNAGGGQEIDETVMLEDIVPTVLETVGLPVPEQPWIEGRSIRPESGTSDRSRLIVTQEIARHKRFAVLQGRFKLLFNRGGDNLALYDLEREPGETVDRLELYPGVASELRSRTEDLLMTQDALAREFGGISLELDPETDAATSERLKALGYLQ